MSDSDKRKCSSERKSIEKLLAIFEKAFKDKNFEEDYLIIERICEKLKNIKNGLREEELENLKKDITDLEIKYDEFNELSYYFNDIYLTIKKKNHELMVGELRKKYKGNKEMK